ncbi:mitogen-activated protein kinase kinase kinase 1-like [Clytia hemisphaerica]
MNVRYQTQEELNTLHLTIKPVIEKILIKCSDSNRRVTILSMKILMEFVNGETVSIQNPSNSTINNTQQHMDLIASCLNQEEDQTQWQWWLGRLSFVLLLFDEHHSQLLLASENRINMASSLPVSPNSDVDLREFFNSLAENVHSTNFTSKTCERILLLARFSARTLSCPHQKVHRHALFLMIKCIAISSQDSVLYPSIKQIVYGLTSNHQSTLYRHLSNESQREQADILDILGEHGEERNEQNTTVVDEEEEQHSLQHQTPTSARLQDVSTTHIASPSTPEVHSHLRPPTSSYDPPLKCVRAVEDEEAAAIAIALDRSQRRPENVIPDQLIPTDDLTIVHIQPEGDKKSKDGEVCKPRNVYLEKIHWKKGGLVGTGAFSSCYEVMDFKSGRIMAVKQISFVRNTEEEQEKVHQIVLEEISLLHRIKHPNIVSCLGATQHQAHYNLFMELMPGGSISSLLGKFGAFSESVTKSYTQQILQAVTYLHQDHTLHRDLKGANLLVDSTGQIVKLSDFGTAARLMANGTGTKEFCGQFLGTIPFMSPEVLRGEHYGRKCDVWSIGCCIIEMASGCPPWSEQHVDNNLALLFKIASSTTGPHIPSSLGPGMRDLTLRCLELKEANRPSSAELLQHAVFRT